LLPLFGLFMGMTNSYGHLSLRERCPLFSRLLFWACMLHITCLYVLFERPFKETMWSQEMLPPWWSQHVFNVILSHPRNRKFMGDTMLPSSRKITTNLWLKFSRII
jgi:hypothetical protein